MELKESIMIVVALLIHHAVILAIEFID